MSRCIVAVMLSTVLTGCIPFPVRWQDTPPVSGQVIDAMSARPVAGATVIVRSLGSARSATTVTGADGTFNLAPVTHWRVIPLPMDVIEPPSTLTIGAAGYRTNELTSSGFKDGVVKLGRGAWEQNESVEGSPSDAADASISCADTTLLGRIVEGSYAALPQSPGHINMDVSWTMRVNVVRVSCPKWVDHGQRCRQCRASHR